MTASERAFQELLVDPTAIHLSDTVLGQGQFGLVALGRLRRQQRKSASPWRTLVASALPASTTLVAVKTVRVLASGDGGGSSLVNAHAAVEHPEGEAGSPSEKPAAGQEQLLQILLEARLMAVLRHPNLVQLLAVNATFLPVLLAMEYCRHGDLLRYLRRQEKLLNTHPEMTLAAICTDMALQAARGLDYLHSKLCVHRDVAARNVLVADLPDGAQRSPCGVQLKLSDLGLSRVLRTEEDYYRKRSDDAVPIKWQCPLSVRSRVYTAKSDVYSFGVLLFEIFSLGQRPFDGLTAAEAFRAAAAGKRLSRPRTDTPQTIYLLQRACTVLEPGKRPAMSTVAEQLELQLGVFEQPHMQDHNRSGVTTHTKMDVEVNKDGEPLGDGGIMINPLFAGQAAAASSAGSAVPWTTLSDDAQEESAL